MDSSFHSKSGDAKGKEEEEEELEQAHLEECIMAFRGYSLDFAMELARRERHVASLDVKYKNRLSQEMTDAKFTLLREAVMVNQQFCELIFRKNLPSMRLETLDRESETTCSANLMDKVRSTFHQLGREWSSEGEPERKACFDPIIELLNAHVKQGSRVLVPGVGLGRLAVEIVRHGYKCQGNEFSHQMLLVSSYIMNDVFERECITIHPWLHNPQNILDYKDMTRPVKIPDRTASELVRLSPERHLEEVGDDDDDPVLSMCAGEFVLAYSAQEGRWDCVVTCFFLDTAPNVIEYIETIHSILKPGGVWINLGPLHWHWYNPTYTSSSSMGGSDERYQISLEISYSEIKHVILGFGFKYLHESFDHNSHYSSDVRSMMKTEYSSILFAVEK